MQVFGVMSLLFCVVCTFFIYVGWKLLAAYIFGISLLLLVVSLALSVKELLISVKALEYRLEWVKKEGLKVDD